ncbi:MAG: hypothetical protein ACT4QD_23160 [Acidobacteriota bacterium]
MAEGKMPIVHLRLLLRGLLVIGCLLAGRSVHAQQAPLGVSPTDEMNPAQIQQLFDAMLVMQAQEVLSLSEDRYAQFLTRLRSLQETRRRGQGERARIMAELQRLTNPRVARPNVSEAEIKERLDALDGVESRSAAEIRKAYHALDEVLDVRQRARFRIFEEQIERRKLELIGRARQPVRPNPPRRQH